MVLNVRQLSMMFPDSGQVFDGVDLALQTSQTALVTGASGSGKTALGLVCCGLADLWGDDVRLRGTVELFGRPVLQGDVPPEVGIVLEHPSAQVSGLKRTVRGELAFSQESRGVPASRIGDAVEGMAARLGIERLIDRNLDDLSGGELQRVIVGATLIGIPRFLFLDRLFTELDAAFRPRLASLIGEYLGHAEGAALYAEDPWLFPEWPVDLRLSLGGEDDGGETMPVISMKEADGPEIFSAEGLTFGFGKREPLFEELSFGVRRGEVVRIAGPNGAGKTTLAKLIAGVLPLRNGVMHLDGTGFHDLTARELALRIGLAFQDPMLHFCRATVAEELALSERWGTGAGELVGDLGLEAFMDVHPLELTRACQKRLGMALAGGDSRRLVILDEPSQYQDAAGFAKVLKGISRILSRGGGVLLITHDPRFDTAIPGARAIRLSPEDTH